MDVEVQKVARIIRKQVKALALDGDLKTNFFPNGEAYTALEALTFDLADHFTERNKRFSRESFLTKCGVKP